jgi:hypothetical protein
MYSGLFIRIPEKRNMKKNCSVSSSHLKRSGLGVSKRVVDQRLVNTYRRSPLRRLEQNLARCSAVARV